MSELALAGFDERQELVVSDWVAIDQTRIDSSRPVQATDNGFTSMLSARSGRPFRGPIAHGYLTLAMMKVGGLP